MRPLTMIGNWKMNGSLAANQELLAEILSLGGPLFAKSAAQSQFGLCVPYPYLPQAQGLLKDSCIALGAQDVSDHPYGAYTGDVSAQMLGEFKCRYVIVGHSERRQFHHEVDEVVAAKALQVLDSGMTPVICVGETADERNSGRAEEVVCSQVAKQVNVLQDRLVDCLIAYEPVWAIGTGKTDTPEQAQKVHAVLRAQLRAATPHPERVSILYGGSMNAANAASLLAMPDIDGGLIGGAALKAADFLTIIQAGSTAP